MSTKNIGIFATIKTVQLPSGVYKHTVIRHDVPGRVHGQHRVQVAYRKTSVLSPSSVLVKRAETIYLGQLLVTLCRAAIDRGDCHKNDLQRVKEELRAKYGYGPGELTPLYTSRQYQHDVCVAVGKISGHPDFLFNDILLEF